MSARLLALPRHAHTPPPLMPTPPEDSAVWQAIDDLHTRAEEGHRRLRESLRELEDDLAAIRTAQLEDHNTVVVLSRTPIDLSKATLPPRLVVWTMGGVLTVALSFWASTSGLRSDVRDILTTQTAQVEITRQVARLTDERNAALKDAIADVRRAYEEQRVQLETLTKMVLAQQRRTSRDQ